MLEDFPVALAAAPHHLIPGKASMAPSRIETCTRAAKGKIKEDIGYNIDGVPNGVLLPHLPEIYWTKRSASTTTASWGPRTSWCTASTTFRPASR